MKYISVKQVAERYHTSPATVWRWVRENKFPPPVKLSPGCTRWRLADVEAWEKSHDVAVKDSRSANMPPPREQLKFTQAELIKMPSDIEEIAGMLETSASILRKGNKTAKEHFRLDSAAWRIADAGLMLSRLIKSMQEWKNVEGVHRKTGFGALLPSDEQEK